MITDNDKVPGVASHTSSNYKKFMQVKLPSQGDLSRHDSEMSKKSNDHQKTFDSINSTRKDP